MYWSLFKKKFEANSSQIFVKHTPTQELPSDEVFHEKFLIEQLWATASES